MNRLLKIIAIIVVASFIGALVYMCVTAVINQPSDEGAKTISPVNILGMKLTLPEYKRFKPNVSYSFEGGEKFIISGEFMFIPYDDFPSCFSVRINVDNPNDIGLEILIKIILQEMDELHAHCISRSFNIEPHSSLSSVESHDVHRTDFSQYRVEVTTNPN